MSNIVTKTIDKLKSGSKETALAQLADKLRKNQIKCTAEGNPITEEELVRDLTADWRYMGRNHQCPCGSGIKYKKCCGRDG